MSTKVDINPAATEKEATTIIIILCRCSGHKISATPKRIVNKPLINEKDLLVNE